MSAGQQVGFTRDEMGPPTSELFRQLREVRPFIAVGFRVSRPCSASAGKCALQGQRVQTVGVPPLMSPQAASMQQRIGLLRMSACAFVLCLLLMPG